MQAYLLLTLLLLAVHYSSARDTPIGCQQSSTTITCAENKWVNITSVVGDSGCISASLTVPACGDADLSTLKNALIAKCRASASCYYKQPSDMSCAALIVYNCDDATATTPRTAETTVRKEDWVNDFTSWQWIIIYIVIGVVLVALIILIVMLVNKCCHDKFNQEKPTFVEATPTASNMGSTLNSRTVSMSTLCRPQPVRKETSQEEIDEIRAQFGTNKKKKDKDYFLDVNTLESKRSDGDGAEAGKYIMGDDSSSGIGSVTYDSRLKHALYDDTDTCHDDYVSYTMKKQAKSPLVNPNAYSTLTHAKKVDESLYKKEAPTVDIHEDVREENFRLDINNWALNPNQRAQQQQKQQDQQQATPKPESPKPEPPKPDVPEQQQNGDVKSEKTEESAAEPDEIYETDFNLNNHGNQTSGRGRTNPTYIHVSDESDEDDDDDHSELKLDLTDLDLSLSYNQFTGRESKRTPRTATAKFYEEFSSRPSSRNPLSVSMMNLHPQSETKTSKSILKRSLSTSRAKKTSFEAKVATKISPTTGRPSSSSLKGEGSKDEGYEAGIKYLTKIRFNETVRFKPDKHPASSSKAHKKKPKGTVRYAVRSDIS